MCSLTPQSAIRNLKSEILYIIVGVAHTHDFRGRMPLAQRRPSVLSITTTEPALRGQQTDVIIFYILIKNYIYHWQETIHYHLSSENRLFHMLKSRSREFVNSLILKAKKAFSHFFQSLF